jgi:hypothetical protein
MFQKGKFVDRLLGAMDLSHKNPERKRKDQDGQGHQTPKDPDPWSVISNSRTLDISSHAVVLVHSLASSNVTFYPVTLQDAEQHTTAQSKYDLEVQKSI